MCNPERAAEAAALCRYFRKGVTNVSDYYFGPDHEPNEVLSGFLDDNPYKYRTIPETVKYDGLLSSIEWLEQRNTSPRQCGPELNELVEVEAADADVGYELSQAEAAGLGYEYEMSLSLRAEFGFTEYDDCSHIPAYCDMKHMDKLPHEIKQMQLDLEESSERERAECFEALNHDVYETEKRYPGLITERTKGVLDGYDEYCESMRRVEQAQARGAAMNGIDVSRGYSRQTQHGPQAAPVQQTRPGPVQTPSPNRGGVKRQLPKGYDDYDLNNNDLGPNYPGS